MNKGLMKRYDGISELSKWMGIDIGTIRVTMINYFEDSKKGSDEWGKSSFRNVPQLNLDDEFFMLEK